MRYVTCPDSIKIYDLSEEDEKGEHPPWKQPDGKHLIVTFKQFFFGRINDERMSKERDMVKKLIRKASAIKPGHIVELSEEEYLKLNEMISGANYIPLIGAQLDPFFDAMKMQSEENPDGAVAERPKPKEVIGEKAAG